MKIPIPCHKKPFRLTVGLRVHRPTTLILVAMDGDHSKTKYVNRKLNFESRDMSRHGVYKEVRIPFPLAPEFMMFQIWDQNKPETRTFHLEKLEVEALEPRNLWEHQDIHRFIPFANWFSQRAGYLPTGMYDSPDHRFLIDYLPVITANSGQPLITPARTNRKTGRIQASKQHLERLSVPVRWFILMHERKHFQLPTRVEKVADLTALKVFLDFGFPKIEAVYAATLAMNAHTPVALQAKTKRLKDIHAFVDQYMTRKAQNIRHQNAA
jgi:hypothetical protein